MSYLGNSPTDQSFVATVDYFNGDGVTVAFTLSRQVASVAQVQAVIENVPQNPSSAFTLMGNVITFTSAPPSGSANIYVYYTSPNTKVMAPSAGTVDTTALAVAAVTPVKMVNYGAELGMRNRIINGDMRIDQRNAGASITNNTSGSQFSVDRWNIFGQQGSKFSIQQSTIAPEGFVNSLLFTSLSAYTPLTGDRFIARQKIEGYNISDLNWGTANAKTVTFSFWARSSLTGVLGGVLMNDLQNRCFPFTFTINSANTWEYKTITVTGDTAGAWEAGNLTGLQIWFSLGAGATYVAPSSGSWLTGNYTAPPTAQSLVATSGATLNITGIQLEKGTLATPFEYRPYGTELALCQRYYEKSYDVGTAPATGTGNGILASTGLYGVTTTNYLGTFVVFKVSKRAAPSMSGWDGLGNAGKGTRDNFGVSNQTNITANFQNIGANGAQVYLEAGNAATGIQIHWAAVAEL